MQRLSYLLSILFIINSALAQCPWQKDVPDLQSACLCAYNLGHELSVQCDQVRKSAPIIHCAVVSRLTGALFSKKKNKILEFFFLIICFSYTFSFLLFIYLMHLTDSFYLYLMFY